MQKSPPQASRSLPTQTLSTDVVVVGGGVAGVCFAIAAARGGAKVILVQDRPVLGGNASSEVRLWMNGATSHGYSNNRWARESGIMNEILMLNVYRNPGGNANIVDTVFLDLVLAEPNITLLLNTSVYSVDKSAPGTISAVHGFNAQNETFYDLRATQFCDASGDGIVGFLAGGAFRIGAEGKDEFDEPFAPDKAFGQLLGHSIYFYSKDAGRPVPYVAPSYALPDIEKAIPRYRDFKAGEDGCRLWWIEFGGRLDTVFDTENIKWELWRIVYGVWNYFKNSGKFPEAANLTLEWVGTIPGKRESRRFEGDYMLTQKDVVQQISHEDDVAYGGWALDLHPADGVFSPLNGCTHSHPKGPYPVPYRVMYSRNLTNLFLAGRIMSCSHVSFGSLRNMASLGYCGQAAGTAASLCIAKKCNPRDLSQGEGLQALRRTLLRNGQHIRGRWHADPADLALKAKVTASSEYALREFPADGEWHKLDKPWAQMVPLPAGPVPAMTVHVRAKSDTALRTAFATSTNIDNYLPDNFVAESKHSLSAGVEQDLAISCSTPLAQAQYGYYILFANDDLEFRCTKQRVTGLLATYNHAQSRQLPATRKASTHDLGVENFELWSPVRRPEGQNFSFRLSAPVKSFGVAQITNGLYRPTKTANAWVAELTDPNPSVMLTWEAPQEISRVVLDFDPDWDHPMESVIRWHHERAMPFTVCDFQIETPDGEVLKKVEGNFQARCELRLPEPISTSGLTLRILSMNGACPAAVFGIGVYT